MSIVDHPMSEGFCERLRPALRLATILLNRAQPFFMTVMMGETYVHVDKDEKHWHALQPLEPESVTAAQCTEYEQGLKKLAKKTRICWLPSRFTGCCNELSGQSESVYLTFLEKVDSRLVHRISIPSRDWQAFGDPHWKEASLQHKCYLWFHFAVTLIHELTHVMWKERVVDSQYEAVHDSSAGRVAYTCEPIILPSYVQELGETWESLQFGGLPFAGPRIRSVAREHSHASTKSLPTSASKKRHTFTNYRDLNGSSVFFECESGSEYVGCVAIDTVARLF